MPTIHNNNCLTCKASRIENKDIVSIVLNQDIKPFSCRKTSRKNRWERNITRIKSYQEAILPCTLYTPKKGNTHGTN